MNFRRDVFQAISDPTRRAILTLLALGTMTPNAIAENFDSSRQTISKHLQILNECELIGQHHVGREIHYYLHPKKVKEVSDWAEQFRQLWEGRLNRMDKILKDIKTKK
jgi:DNA-binding transcriptional ArsR family regulator